MAEMQPWAKPASRPFCMSAQRLTRVKAIHWPVGETCGSSSNIAVEGVVVTRVASLCVTPSPSEAGMSQTPSSAG
jgi:hypothetical protein